MRRAKSVDPSNVILGAAYWLNRSLQDRPRQDPLSPVVLVPKTDGKSRFFVDYRKLNAKIIRDSYPIPRMDDCIDSLGGAKVFRHSTVTPGMANANRLSYPYMRIDIRQSSYLTWDPIDLRGCPLA